MAHSNIMQANPPGSREALLAAGMVVFRRRGYAETNVDDLLAAANISKGAFYHLFPDGKEELAVEVIRLAGASMEDMFEEEAAETAEQTMRLVGKRLYRWMESTSEGVDGKCCALIASFVTAREVSPKIAAICHDSYVRIATSLSLLLVEDGWAKDAAMQVAYEVISLIEGAGLIGRSIRNDHVFINAIETAAMMCRAPSAPHRLRPVEPSGEG